MDKTIKLLISKRFSPVFWMQIFGAFNDHLLKTALAVGIGYQVFTLPGDKTILVTLAAGVFVLPFLLFSALAGQLADRFDRRRLMQSLKFLEILIMALASLGFFSGNVALLFFSLFLMGAQSAFLSPAKYSALPEWLKEDELLTGNGLAEGAIFIAILFGTIVGSLLVVLSAGAWYLSAVMVGLAVIGFLATLWMPPLTPIAKQAPWRWNLFKETFALVAECQQTPRLFYPVLAVVWFYIVGATFIAQFPNFVPDVLQADNTVATFFLALFSIAIAVGSVLCHYLLQDRITLAALPFAALLLSLFTIDLYFAMQQVPDYGQAQATLEQFLGIPSNWRIVMDLALIAFFAGVYVVPLYAWLQHKAAVVARARVFAALNILTALWVTVATLLTAALLVVLPVDALFLVLGVLSLLVTALIIKALTRETVQSLLWVLFKLVYRVEVRGLEHYPKDAERLVIVCNHVSYLDAPILALFLPKMPLFAISPVIADAWWVKPWLRFAKVVRVDTTKPIATKTLIKQVKLGEHCVVFPEGRLTETATIMKVYEGAAMIAARSEAQVLPVHLEGVEYTPFSRLGGRVKQRFFGKVILTIAPPVSLSVAETLTFRQKRTALAVQLYDLLCETMYNARLRPKNLLAGVLAAAEKNGEIKELLEDADRKPLGYKKFFLGVDLLGREIAKQTQPSEKLGILLPNAAGTVVTFFALHSQGRIPAMLNFSAGAKAILSAMKIAQIQTLLTSRRFIEQGKLQDLLVRLQAEAPKLRIIYLDDLRGKITTLKKLNALFFAPSRLKKAAATLKPDDPAVVLFTSGSEGSPKAVVLSHDNILANCYQVHSRLDFHNGDKVFNALPMFHSFGITVGTVLPLLFGVRLFVYPSPLHYRIVPELVYTMNATIFLSTDTFLNGYARLANAYDFRSVRYLVAGAEKVKASTRQLWAEKFGLRILEGYGATETAPVLALNNPILNQAGSVGRLVPGISYRLEAVPGIAEGGRLWVKGANVMLGYIKAESPGVLQPPTDGWYDTGDIVQVDAFGFVRIQGRAKRFAKIGGEMISLAAVEEWLAGLFPEGNHAVIAMPDAKKGEQLLWLTDAPQATRENLSQAAKNAGHSELWLPKKLHHVAQVPVFASGKIDYPAAQQLLAAAFPPDVP
jgi:acyl-[acyl-carrier-protein]-phospholipid O-acyltransferase/long-chain-fatty-acid--[acyl-carrier-protein] ligase